MGAVDLLLLRPPCFVCPQCSTTRSSNSAARKPKTRLLRKLQSSQVNCNCCSDYTLDEQFSNWGNGSLGRDRNTSLRAINEGLLLRGGSWKERDAHWDATLQCHRPWQPQASTHLSSFWLLYSRNHPRVTSFSDPGPPQAPFSSSHLLIYYYCPALLPGHSTVVSGMLKEKDLQRTPLRGQPLPPQRNRQLQGKAYCRAHRIMQQ